MIAVWFHLLLLLLQCLWLFQIGVSKAACASRPPAVNIGAILTYESTIGRVAKIAIEQAIADVNINSSVLPGTQLTLFMHNVSCAGFPALLDGLQLVGADVAAIIGPQSSLLAHVVSGVANDLQLPLVSFGATDPALSSHQYPFFVRMTQSDLYQMAAVADTVVYFGWREVIALYTDDEYGRNGVVALGGKLKEKRCRISHKFRIRLTATQEEIGDVLTKVALVESRILVLHANLQIGFQVLSQANHLGMMGNGYVWIATDWLSSFLDSALPVPQDTIDQMQGVLVLRQHTPHSNQKTEFLSRWKKVTGGSVGLNPYSLYAYDAVWLVAHALEAMFSKDIFDNQRLLLKNIWESDFEGLAGRVKFDTDGSLVFPAYEVINVLGTGLRRVGYWSNHSGLSTKPPTTLLSWTANGSSNSKLQTVIWPGDTVSIPRGWVVLESEKQLKIGVPNRVSFLEFVAQVEGSGKIQGFCIDVFEAAAKLMPYNVNYQFIPFGDGKQNPNYTELVDKITIGEFDGVVGDIAIVKDRMKTVTFSRQYASSGLVLVAPFVTEGSDGWAFLKPFTPTMWLVTACFFIFIGAIVWLMEHRVNDEFRGPRRQQAVTFLWFSFNTMFFTQRENTLSSPGRLVVLTWLFVVFIINSSYTASLTTILTVRPLSSTVKGLHSLVASSDPIGYQVGSFVATYLSESLNVSESRLVSLGTPEEYAAALTAGPGKGGVAAIIDERPYVDLFLKAKCTFRIVGQELTSSGWGFAFPKGSELADDMSTAILELDENGELEKIYERWLTKSSCTSDGAEITAKRLELKSFWMLYLFFALVCSVAMLVRFVKRCRRVAQAEDEGSLLSGNSRRVRRFMKSIGDRISKRRKVEKWEDESASVLSDRSETWSRFFSRSQSDDVSSRSSSSSSSTKPAPHPGTVFAHELCIL